MFDTLYSRLAVGLVALVVGLTAAWLWIGHEAGQRFYQERNQRLNQQLAANLIADTRLSVADGRYDETLLHSVFHSFMVINPSIEVYLLDDRGNILAYEAPAEKIRRQRVALGPVREFLDANARLPILGDNPRSVAGRDIFSVAPIGDRAKPDGYLYVVLAGEQLQSLTRVLQASHIPRLGLAVFLATSVLATIAGLLLLRYLTRRLNNLSLAMRRFEDSDFEEPPLTGATQREADDDIGRLRDTFVRLAGRVTRQMRELRRADDLRRELVANVSHDLRTPLACLHGYLETLSIKQDRLTAAEQREFLTLALRQCHGLARRVDALFELAKLDAGQTPFSPERFSLAELAQDVSRKQAMRASHQRVALNLSAPDRMAPVEADIALIERMLDNLLDNALRHTPGPGRIDVVLFEQDDRVGVRVTDSGVGISERDLPQVFDRFYRARDRCEPSDGGAGLGLAICKRIVELHRGRIGIESREGTGTSVTFTLPRAAVDDAAGDPAPAYPSVINS